MVMIVSIAGRTRPARVGTWLVIVIEPENLDARARAIRA
jgi:hypothetical protein